MSLSSTQQNALKLKLEQLKQSVQEELQKHNPSSLHLENEAGDGVIPDVLSHDAMAQYLHQHGEWQALQRALARLNENIIDVCCECGATIPYARLEVEPTAERCISCQEQLEADDQRLHMHVHSSM